MKSSNVRDQTGEAALNHVVKASLEKRVVLLKVTVLGAFVNTAVALLSAVPLSFSLT